MIGKKLVLVRNGHSTEIEHIHLFPIDFKKIKYSSFQITKKFIYIMIFITLRSYLLSSKFIKEKSKILIKKIENKLKKNIDGISDELEKKEVSKYLKMISEYRQKIRKMKHQIKREEGIE